MDPSKKYVQYPEALKLLGDLSNQDILDVGTGNGVFAKRTSEQGARVVGYDISNRQIEIAKAENIDPHIEYLVSDPANFVPDRKFDKAVSIMVYYQGFLRL